MEGRIEREGRMERLNRRGHQLHTDGCHHTLGIEYPCFSVFLCQYSHGTNEYLSPENEK